MRAGLAFLFLLLATAAHAQQPVTVIGPVVPGNCVQWFSTSQLKDPGITCNGGASTSPGGSNLQVQYNNAGTFGGYTNAQLTALINIATASLSGALPAWPNNTTTYFRGDGSYQTLNFAAIGGTLSPSQCPVATTGAFGCVKPDGSTITISAGVLSSPGGGVVVANVITYGADNTCTSDSTTAFQNAWNAAAAAGGSGIVYVPPVPSGGCYKVSKINGTNAHSVTVQGNGDQSLITATSNDTSGNWWDLSGSYNISLKNLKITASVTINANAFLWACTGTSCATSGVLSGLSFDHVNVAVGTNISILYGYGYGGSGGNQKNSKIGGASLSISNSTWTQLTSGSNACAATAPNLCNTTLHLTAVNDYPIASAYVSVGTATAVAAKTLLSNVDLVDYPSGYGAGTFDANTGLVLYNVQSFSMVGGSIECVCNFDETIWSNSEGISHTSTSFVSSDGAAGSVKWIQYIGGGQNGIIHFDNTLWTSPSQAFIVIGPEPSSFGGPAVNELTITNADVGLNASMANFITTQDGTSGTCGTFTASNVWIAGSLLNLTAGANNIISCGTIDAHTIIQNPGTIAVASGGTDNSHHF